MSKVSQQFAEGELVNVQIKNARVIANDGVHPLPYIRVQVDNQFGQWDFDVPTAYPGVDVTRVAPAEWPPQVGDRWFDRKGDEWVALFWDGAVRLYNIDADHTTREYPENVMESVGPMRLDRRRGWTPAADTTPAAPEPEQVDKRAAMVAGFRALADLLEAHPEIPMGASLGGQTYYLGLGDDTKIRAAIERDAATLGVTLRERQHSTDPACIVISGDYPVGGGVALALHASVATAAPLPHRNPDDARMSLDEALADAEANGHLPAEVIA